QVFASSISVTLGSNGNPNGTTLVISTGTSGHFDVTNSSIGIVSGANTTLVIVGLTPNTGYGFQGGARDTTANAATQVITVTASTTTLASVPTVTSFQIFTTSMSVTLGANGNPNGTTLMVSTGVGGHYAVTNSSIGAVSGANTTLVVTGLSANTDYSFQAGARDTSNAASTQTVILTASTSTLVTVPGAGSFVGVSATSVTIAWETNGNPLTPPTSYQMQVSTSSDFVVASTSVTFLTQASSSTLTPNTTYFFRVAAFGRSGDTSAYNTAISTLTGSKSPATVNFQVFTTSITVVLAPNGNSQGTTVTITTGAFETATSSSGITGAGNTTLVLSNLIANREYTVQTRAIGYTNAPSSTTVVASTATLPSVPGTITFMNVDESSITLSWESNGNSLTPPTSYQVQVSSGDPNFTTFSASTTFLTSGSTSTLVANTTYYFRIFTFGVGGSASTFGTVQSTFTRPSVIPSTPTAFRATSIGISSITYTWNDASGNEDGFRILNSTNGLYGVVAANNTSLAVLGLSPNTLVEARLSAFNNIGVTTHTVTLSSYTLANPPANPAFTFVGRSEVRIEWSTNSNPSTVLYEVSKSTDNFTFAAGISTPIAFSVGLTSATATVSGLTAGGTYYFRVRARNSDTIAT
ncbi:MAG: fibronectin type III domain-containing protein, partial [Elusimicrobia bacterium]|nr:fibronectin type III domain-containing protein [Elusimicrobiota bacterium]